MKIITETKDAEGLEGLLGEQIIIICACYFYVGRLIGVNEKCVKLEKASIVYETGAWTDKSWKDAQPLGDEPHYVATSMIESFRKGK